MSESRFPWRTLLFISAALNLLIIGAIAGAAGAGVRFQREAAGAVVDRMPAPRAFLAALPPDTRAKMRRELARTWTESRELRRAALQARAEAFEAAAAEPYDAERVRAAFARQREADQAAIAVFHDNVAGVFATLTPEERSEALDALRAWPRSRRGAALDEGEQEDAAGPAVMGEEAAKERSLRQQRREAWRERRRQRMEQLREN